MGTPCRDRHLLNKVRKWLGFLSEKLRGAKQETPNTIKGRKKLRKFVTRATSVSRITWGSPKKEAVSGNDVPTEC